MADPCHFHPNTNEDFSWQNQSFKLTSTQKFSDPLAGNDVDGRSMLGFSLTSPDLVICAGSPDMPGNSYGDSPVLLKNEYHKNMGPSIDISLEKGINGSEIDGTHQTPAAKISTLWQTSEEDEDVFLEASFELLPAVALQDDKLKDPLSVISINVGSEDGAVVLDGVNFLEDNCFMGGDTIRTDAMIRDGEGLPLYQTARFGNFSYKFDHWSLEII
ncbi:hypothetical protein L1049_000221 [Liquidambar formosana]|uniref:Uncharacterized protein n=1 Tax=Liquidambar formosana TaxID=63359 RepID=A0AAP0R4N8_LIQFO